MFRTGRWLLDLSAREFFDRVVRRQIAARGSSKDRISPSGTIARATSPCSASGAAPRASNFEVVDPIEEDGRLISSSRIREALREGSAEEASKFLGRPHRIRGIVAHGSGRGAGIGVPTVNLEHIDTLIPADGVYATRAFLNLDPDAPGGPTVSAWPAACHIGPNATFGEHARTVEAHLIGFDGDLYGQTGRARFPGEVARHQSVPEPG